MIDMFSVHHVEKGEQIDLRKMRVVGEVRPIRVYIKPDGAKDDTPSFCFVQQTSKQVVGHIAGVPPGVEFKTIGGDAVVIGQVSAKMFRPFYEELKKIYGDA